MHPAMPVVPQPPRGWRLGTAALIAIAAAGTLVSLFLIMLYVSAYLRATGEGLAHGFDAVSPGSTLYNLVLESASWLDWISLALAIGCLWGVYRLKRGAANLMESLGEPRDLAQDVTRNWAFKLSTALLIVSVLLRFFGFGSVDDPTNPELVWVVVWSAALAIAYAPRLLALVFLLVGVALLRARLRRALTALPASPYGAAPYATAAPLGSAPSVVRPAPGPAFLAPGAVPAPACVPAPVSVPTPAPVPAPAWSGAAPGAAPGAAAMTTVPVADDAFWERVRALSAEQGDDLALLETATSGPRWLIVPAGDPPRVRAEIAPGSIVTVYPEPPRPGIAAPTKVPAAAPGTEWYGLIEDAGTTGFQLLLPTRLPDWLARASRAHRYGLYRAGDPAALIAAMPPH